MTVEYREVTLPSGLILMEEIPEIKEPIIEPVKENLPTCISCSLERDFPDYTFGHSHIGSKGVRWYYHFWICKHKATWECENCVKKILF